MRILLAVILMPALLFAGRPPAIDVTASLDDPQTHALDRIVQKLARVDRGEKGAIARISVYGDSHVASDLFTGALRRRLQGRLGDAGHGFVLLGSAWPLYRHMDIEHGATPTFRTRRLRPRDRVPFRFGLGSAVSSTAVPGAVAWASTCRRGPVGQSVSRIEILYERAPGNGDLAIRLDGRPVATIGTDAPHVEAGYHVLDTSDDAHRLELEARGPGPVTVFGAVLERSGPGVVVDSLGVPALASAALLSSEAGLLAEHVRHRNPDLVVFAFGTNDVRLERIDLAQVRRDIARILRVLAGSESGQASSCLVLGPIDRVHRPRDGQWAASLVELIDAQRLAAADAGCAFLDQRTAMGGEGSMQRWMAIRPRVTLRDGVHLAARGYDALAAALARELLSKAGVAEEATVQWSNVGWGNKRSRMSTDLPRQSSSEGR